VFCECCLLLWKACSVVIDMFLQIHFLFVNMFHVDCLLVVCDAKPVIDLKASDVVRQSKIADMSPRGAIRDGNADSGSRLRSSETAPDSLYTRSAADGDSVSVGVEWTGGDVRLFCNA